MIPSGRVVAFYGDDFSGSTDVMEVLAANGLETVLFLDIPEGRQLERFPNCRAIGIAGCSRSQNPAWMDAHLPQIFRALQALQASLCHYKVCSTFDSSPQVGSIGRALDIGQEVFGSAYVPLLVGAPALRRYCVFGNLFATVNGETHRLDRHPTMSQHPVTPMAESDLRLHLAAQTSKRIGLLDILALRSEKSSETLQRLVSQGSEVILFDILDEASLLQAGRLLWSSVSQGSSFLVGSSGVEYALASWWRSSGLLPPPVEFPSAGETDRIIVVSGSGSPVTESQIRWAMARGFASVAIDVLRLLEQQSATAELARVLGLALAEAGVWPQCGSAHSLGSQRCPTVAGRPHKLTRTAREDRPLSGAVAPGGSIAFHREARRHLRRRHLGTCRIPAWHLRRDNSEALGARVTFVPRLVRQSEV